MDQILPHHTSSVVLSLSDNRQLWNGNKPTPPSAFWLLQNPCTTALPWQAKTKSSNESRRSCAWPPLQLIQAFLPPSLHPHICFLCTHCSPPVHPAFFQTLPKMHSSAPLRLSRAKPDSKMRSECVDDRSAARTSNPHGPFVLSLPLICPQLKTDLQTSSETSKMSARFLTIISCPGTLNSDSCSDIAHIVPEQHWGGITQAWLVSQQRIRYQDPDRALKAATEHQLEMREVF